MSTSKLLDTAETYLSELEHYIREELRYTYNKLRQTLAKFQENPTNVRARIDLESIIAYFERRILPILSTSSLKQDKKYYIRKSEMMTIQVSDDWQAQEFHELFLSINFLHNLFYLQKELLEQESPLVFPKEFSRGHIFRKALIDCYVPFSQQLKVKRMYMGSDGLISFKGAEKAIRDLIKFIENTISLEFVRRIIDLYDYIRYDRSVKNKKRELILTQITNQILESERKESINQLKDLREYLEQLHGLEATMRDLGIKELADPKIVENNFFGSIALLHKLGFEKRKISTSSQD